METFKNRVTIRRTAEEVFAFLADFENVPRWNYAIASTTKVSPGPVGVGTVYRQIRSIPSRAEEGFEVTVFQPGRRLAVEGEIGPFHARVSYLLESLGNATRLTNDIELEPSSTLTRLLAPLAVSRVKAAVAQNLEELRRILEAEERARSEIG
jgi:carbon monoxide dehydrogenase subunit G